MIKINLLGDTLVQVAGKKADKGEAIPVYGQESEVKRKSFPLVGVVVSLFFIAFGVIYYIGLSRKVGEQQIKKADLEKQKQELAPYEKLEAKFRKDKELLERKKAIIKDLRVTQHLPVHLMEELANALPDDVWFQEISQKGSTISIKGQSASFEAINLFRTHPHGPKNWFGNVNYPTASKKGNIVEFTLSFDVKKPG